MGFDTFLLGAAAVLLAGACISACRRQRPKTFTRPEAPASSTEEMESMEKADREFVDAVVEELGSPPTPERFKRMWQAAIIFREMQVRDAFTGKPSLRWEQLANQCKDYAMECLKLDDENLSRSHPERSQQSATN